MQIDFVIGVNILLKSANSARVVLPVKDSKVIVENANYTVRDITYNYDSGVITVHLKRY